MSRNYCKELTKEMLLTWGIESIKWDTEVENWVINRYWFKNNSKSKVHTVLKIQNAVCKHKFTCDKSYPIVTFSYKQERITIPLSRFVYAWFYGVVESGEVIDHIDNNPYNNYINENDLNDPKNNLQKLSVGENLAKRFIDNASNNRNQYTTKVYKNVSKNPELYKMCKAMFDAGVDYSTARVVVSLYTKDGE